LFRRGSNSKRLRPDAHQCQNPINWAVSEHRFVDCSPSSSWQKGGTRSSTGREIELSRAPLLGFRPGQSILAALPTENPERLAEYLVKIYRDCDKPTPRSHAREALYSSWEGRRCPSCGTS